MKHRKLFGIALLFPYLFWIICALIIFPLSRQEMPDIWEFILVPIAYYVIGVFLWFIPYTLLAIGMWFWSKDKSIASLRKLGLSAPIIFSGLMAIGYAIIMFTNNSYTTDWTESTGFLLLFIFCSLVFGYLFVGIALAIYQSLQKRGYFQSEPQEVQQNYEQP